MVDRAQFVMYQTILTVCSVIVTAYFGKRMAQGNIKLIMVISALCSVAGYVILANAGSISWFYVGAVLLGGGILKLYGSSGVDHYQQLVRRENQRYGHGVYLYRKRSGRTNPASCAECGDSVFRLENISVM